MTRHQLFGAILLGAGALILISTAFSGDHDDDGLQIVINGDKKRHLSGDSVEIESSSRGMIVHTKDGSIDCKKNGGTVVINRSDGSTTEITCD